MATKSISSRYDALELAAWDKVRGGVAKATYQKEATIARINAKPAKKWADFMGVNPGPAPSDNALAKITELGLTWCSISPEMGWMNNEAMKYQIKRVHDHGLKCMAVLQNAGHDYTGVSQNAWNAYALTLADSGADAITIGNEWNNPAFWKVPDSQMGLAAILSISALLTIRMQHPYLPVYAPGWSPAGGNLAPALVMEQFCKRMRERLVPPMLFTGASHHPYVYNGIRWGMPQHPEWNAFAQTPQVYTAAAANGMPGPMSLSEYGVPSAGKQAEYPEETFNEQSQAEKIRDYLNGFADFRRMGLPIAYMGLSTAIDGDATTRPIESSMGVFRKDLSAKPAAEVVKKFAQRDW